MKKLIAILALLFSWNAISAQPSNSSFLHYTTDQGLSNDHVLCISKDNLGFLWVGTVNGLNRFDGRTFKIFRHNIKDKNSIPQDNINGITVAPDGWLWVATSGGLCKIDPHWLRIEQIPLPENQDTINNDIVTQVAFDSKGMAWTTTESGICKINPANNKLEFFYKAEPETLGWYGMMIDRQDRVWVIKDYLRRFDPTTNILKTFRSATNLSLGALSAVQDSSGQIWAGTWGNGILKFNPKLDEFDENLIPGTLAMNIMPEVTPAGRSFFWIGGGQSGLAAYFPDTKDFFQFEPDTKDPFTHNNYLATSFFKDTVSGDVWIGTEVGLEQYAPATIRFGRAMIPPEKDMGQFSLVSGVAHDNTDVSGHRYFIAVWGTGLFAWDKSSGKFERLRSNSKLTSENNFNLFQDSHGMIWGCRRGGVSSYNPQTRKFYDYETRFLHPDRNNLFWKAIEDHEGNIWFCSNKEGIFHYNPKSNVVESVHLQLDTVNAKGFFEVMDVSEDNSGRLWLACNAGGVIRFDPKKNETIHFSYPGKHASLHCNAIQAAANGKIYAGFYDVFVELDEEGKILRQFNEESGLKTSRLYFMVEDLQGKIWFNSAYLLHCYDPVSGTFTYYGKADGLFSNSMTDGLSITPSGEIFVGFQNAFNFFFPDRLRHNPQPPPIAITSIKVMNKARDVMTSAGDTFLLLNPGEDFFEIEFAALNYNQQERNRYAYWLDGFNKDWVYTDRPVASFTNLNGGNYVLHMKAANNDGVWNENGTTLDIRVNPSFYKTWWFPFLIGLGLAGLGFGFLWYRRQQRKHLEKFRENLARDLHDEMGSTLSSIRFFSEYADQQIGNDKPQVTPVLQRISQSATNLSESMQDIIWAMQTDHDQLEDLTSHMMEFGLRLLESRNIKFKTHIADSFSGKQLKPEVRRNIYLIFKEAVNNIAKYSEATEVVFDFGLKKGVLTMKINDNGRGFDLDSLQTEGSGNGLKNMKQRATEIGGKLEISSHPGDGTRVEIMVEI